MYDRSLILRALQLQKQSRNDLSGSDDDIIQQPDQKEADNPTISITLRTAEHTEANLGAKSKSRILWQGTLYKRSTSFIASWQSRRFLLRAQRFEASTDPDLMTTHPVLGYKSKTKGKQHLTITDVRRERHLDCDARICFSVGVECPTGSLRKLDLKPARNNKDRVLLMAMSDLEAVALLTCLRRILEPGRALPTLWDAAHFPAQALRMLE